MSSPPFKALALDLDGTLLDGRGRLSSRSIRTLRAVSELGVRIVLASGRMTARIAPFAEELGIPVDLISCNGAEILEGPSPARRSVAFRSIGMAARDAVLELCRSHGVFLNIYAGGKLYCYHPAGDFAFSRFYEAHTGAEYASKHMSIDDLPREGIAKLLAIESPENRERLFTAWSPLLAGYCDVTKSNPEYLEFLGLGVSKGSALSIWLSGHSLERRDLLAFGDAENDLEMLTLAGLGIAMANATPGLRALYTRFSAWSHDQDAVAKELIDIFGLDAADA